MIHILARLVDAPFRIGFVILRTACYAQATALVTAVFLAVSFAPRDETPPWVRSTVVGISLLAVTFLATGVLLHWISWRRAQADELDGEDGGAPGLRHEQTPRPLPWLGPSMGALALLSLWQAADLVALWREALALLDLIGIQDAMSPPHQFSGAVLAPIFVVLYTPALEAVAAFLLIVVPVGLIGLHALRRPSFSRMYFLMVTGQAGFVLAGIIAADLFSRLVNEITPVLIGDGDIEGVRVAERLASAGHVLVSTSLRFLAPLVGYLAWVPVLIRAPRRDAS